MRGRRAGALLVAGASLLAAGAARAGSEPDALIAVKVAIVKPGKLAKVVARGSFALPADPNNDPTVGGGSLTIFDVTTPGAGSNMYNLPSSGWKGLGNPAGSKGFKYKGTGAAADPCRVVLVKPAVIKAVCKGPGVTLAPPFAGPEAFVLSLGASSKRYCGLLGGDETRNTDKILKRKNADAPGSCLNPPFVDPCAGADCGDGIFQEGCEQCDPVADPNGDCNESCESTASTCAPPIGSRDVVVSIETPQPLAGVQLNLEYPQALTSIPGFANSSVVQGRVMVLKPGLFAVNDRDTDFTIVLANSTASITSGDVFKLTFDECAPEAENFCNRNLNVIGCCNNPLDPLQFGDLCAQKRCDLDPNDVCTSDADCSGGATGPCEAVPCDGDGDCAGPPSLGTCVFRCPANPPVCPVGNFPTSSIGDCFGFVCEENRSRRCANPADPNASCPGGPPLGCIPQPDGGCPADNACLTQAEGTTCSVTGPADASGQPVAGVTCSVSIQ
jgi:hypothetical protein